MLIKRTSSNGANDLNTTYRPCTVDELIGHDVNKTIISNGLKKGTLSHSLLFTGPAGCGKTTTARILALGLNCEKTEVSTDAPCLECRSCKSTLNQMNLDVIEINVGKSGGKAAVDKITSDLGFSPTLCRNKVLIFDEAHELTKAAQDLLLKEIEDGYSHVYFIFCTNKPEKLSEAFLSRTTNMHFGPLPDTLIQGLLTNICEYEGVQYTPEIIDYIVESAKGAPREAIVSLKAVLDEGSWELSTIKEIISHHSIDEDNPDIMEIGKSILNGKFKQAISVLTKLKAVPEETIRAATAGFFTTKLKYAKTFEEGLKYSRILDIITEPIYQSGKPAHHILVNYIFKSVYIIVKGE